MIKWCSKLFATLISLIHNQGWVASAAGGLNALANVMIVGNLATKDPFIKIGEMVLFVPKFALSAAKYTLDFFKKHPFISFPLLALFGYGLFKIVRGQILKEGINNAWEFVNNLLFYNDKVIDDDRNALLEEFQKMSANPDNYESQIDMNTNPANAVHVEVSLFDFDKSGEVSYSEFLKGERIIRSLRRIDKDVLYVLQNVTEHDIDFISLLKKARVYQYEKTISSTI